MNNRNKNCKKANRRITAGTLGIESSQESPALMDKSYYGRTLKLAAYKPR